MGRIKVGSFGSMGDFGSRTRSPFAARLRYLGLKAPPFVREGGRKGGNECILHAHRQRHRSTIASQPMLPGARIHDNLLPMEMLAGFLKQRSSWISPPRWHSDHPVRSGRPRPSFLSSFRISPAPSIRGQRKKVGAHGHSEQRSGCGRRDSKAS